MKFFRNITHTGVQIYVKANYNKDNDAAIAHLHLSPVAGRKVVTFASENKESENSGNEKMDRSKHYL